MSYVRKLSGLVFIFLFICMGAWGQSSSRVLVVYYSRDGHTKMVAEKLAQRFGADIERLIDKRKRTGPIGFPRAGKDAVAGNLTELEPLTYNPQRYDIILVGTPGWWSNVTPAVRTFVTENDVSEKRIGIFGTVHLTGIENALAQVAQLVSQENSEVIPTLPSRHRDLQEEILSQKIDEFYLQVMGAD